MLKSAHAPNSGAYAIAIGAEWRALLASAPGENEVQAFLELHPAILPGAHDLHRAGNHPPVWGSVFRQARLEGLGPKRYPDFMWLAKSTWLIKPVLIEIEKPSKRWFNIDGSFTHEFTQARQQLEQWRAWFSDERNVAIFRQTYIPDRFSNWKVEPHFVLVIGRQAEFDEPDREKSTRSERQKLRQALDRHDETYLTYDSLRWEERHDSTLTASIHSDGRMTVWSVPPTFSGTTFTTSPIKLGSIEDALVRAPHMTDPLRKDIRGQWQMDLDLGKRVTSQQISTPSWP